LLVGIDEVVGQQLDLAVFLDQKFCDCLSVTCNQMFVVSFSHKRRDIYSRRLVQAIFSTCLHPDTRKIHPREKLLQIDARDHFNPSSMLLH
jgi:hypothetical protein